MSERFSPSSVSKIEAEVKMATSLIKEHRTVILQSDVWDSYEDEAFIDACKSMDLKYVTANFDTLCHLMLDFHKKPYLLHGSILSINVFMDNEELHKYDYLNYYHLIQDVALNDMFYVFPYYMLNVQYVKDLFAGQKRWFIKPNSGLKTFTGTTLTTKWWDKELEIIKDLPSSAFSKDELVIIAPAKDITEEFRLFVCPHRKQIITYGKYTEGNNELDLDKAHDVLDKCSFSIFDQTNPIVVDLALLPNGDLKVIEMNYFMTSGWYNADYRKILSYSLGLQKV